MKHTQPGALALLNHGANFCPSCGFNMRAINLAITYANGVASEPRPAPAPAPVRPLSQAKAPGRTPSPRKVTEDERSRAMDLKYQGKSVNEIAKVLNRDWATVARILADSKSPPPSKPKPAPEIVRPSTERKALRRRRVSTADRTRIMELLKQGKSVKEIASELHRPTSTIHKNAARFLRSERGTTNHRPART